MGVGHSRADWPLRSMARADRLSCAVRHQRVVGLAAMTLAIGVHVPKAGGTSLRAALARHFGPDLFLDYGDRVVDPDGQRQRDPDAYLRRRDTLPRGTRGVFGHFHPIKYDHLDATRFTILRHPVDTLIATYFFWLSQPPTHALHRAVVDRELGIRELASVQSTRHLMSRTYFEGVDMGRFDVIGRHEERASAIARISALLGLSEVVGHENPTPGSPQRDEALSDPKLRADLSDLLSDDIQFYEQWAR